MRDSLRFRGIVHRTTPSLLRRLRCTRGPRPLRRVLAPSGTATRHRHTARLWCGLAPLPSEILGGTGRGGHPAGLRRGAARWSADERQRVQGCRAPDVQKRRRQLAAFRPRPTTSRARARAAGCGLRCPARPTSLRELPCQERRATGGTGGARNGSRGTPDKPLSGFLRTAAKMTGGSAVSGGRVGRWLAGCRRAVGRRSGRRGG